LFLNIVRVALVVFIFGFSAFLSIDPFTTVLIYSVSMIFVYVATFYLAQNAMKSVSVKEDQV